MRNVLAELTVLSPYEYDSLTREKLSPVFPIPDSVRSVVNAIAGFGTPHFLLRGEKNTYLLTFPNDISQIGNLASYPNRSPYRIEVESIDTELPGISAYHYTYTRHAEIKTEVVGTVEIDPKASIYDPIYFSQLKDTIYFEDHHAIAVVRVNSIFLIFVYLSYRNTSPPATELWGILARTREDKIWKVLKGKKIKVFEKTSWGEEKKIKELTWEDFDDKPVKLQRGE